MAAIVGAVMTPKGGNGKTPIINHLARYAQIQGLDVLLLVTDKTSSTVEWLEDRKQFFEDGKIDTADFPNVEFMSLEDAEEYALKTSDEFDLILIDTQADFDEKSLSILRVIDLIIMPLKTGLENFRSAAKGVILIEEYKEKHGMDYPPLTVALNQVKSTLKLREMVKRLSEFNLSFYPTKTVDRGCYSDSYEAGQTIFDSYTQAKTKTKRDKLEKGHFEIRKLCQEIVEKMISIKGESNG